MTKILIVSADRSTAEGYAHNLGDAVLSDALRSALQSRGASVDVVDFGGIRKVPEEPRRFLRGPWELWRAVGSADSVVVGGGTLLQDDVGRGWGGLPRLVAVVSLMCRLAGRPLYFFGVGCDPVDRPIARLLLRIAVWRRTVWVRDERSMSRARGLGCSDVRLGADTALFVAAKCQTVPAAREVGVILALARSDATMLDAASVAELKRRYSRVTFVQMDQGDDSADAQLVATSVLELIDQVTVNLKWLDAVSLYRGADVVIASRMHALYLGMMCGVPLVAVGDRPKVVSFAGEFDVDALPDLGDAKCGLRGNGVEQSRLTAACDRAELAADALMAELQTRFLVDDRG